MTTRPALAIACATVVLGIASLSAHADTIIVNTTAGFDTALDTANPGDEILLEPGTYTGGIFAAGVTGVTVASLDATNPAVIDATGRTNGIQLSDAVDVTLADLVIENASANGLNIDDGGSFATPSQNVTLRNLTVRNIGSSGNHDGIKLSGVTGFHVDSVRVTNWGSGGSAVDMVGSHRGLIENSFFSHDAISATGSGVRPKGGSKDVTIRANRFEMSDGRAIQTGGSTGSQFFRFIDGDSGYEADDITAEGNVVIGGSSSFSWSVIDGGVFHHNYAQRPNDWVLRILNEAPELATDTSNGRFTDNVVLFGDNLRRHVNVGPNTEPETYVFERNLWYNADDPNNSTPDLPTPETDPADEVDPAVDPGINRGATDPITWSFDWGRWLVNANDATGQVTIADPELFLIATPAEDDAAATIENEKKTNGSTSGGGGTSGAGEFEPLESNPLSGQWDLTRLTQDTVDLDPFSQVILVLPQAVSAPGDANSNGRVDAGDLNNLALNWQGTDKTWFEADFNNDATVDAADLNLLALNWQSGVSGVDVPAVVSFDDAMAIALNSAAIPEPTTLMTLIAPVAGFLTQRRKQDQQVPTGP